MRILHAIQELNTGGAERIAIALAHGARRAGHEVALAATTGTLANGLGMPIFPLPIVGRRVRRLPAAAWAMRRALRAWALRSYTATIPEWRSPSRWRPRGAVPLPPW